MGIENAASTAAKLGGVRFDKIVSSDLGRAFTTAYLVSRKLGYSSDIEQLKDLREVNYGDLGNLPYTGANSAYPVLTPEENTSFVPPNGESLAQMQQRVMACIENISQNNSDKIILISAHDGTINAVRASFEGTDMGHADAVHNAHDFVAKFTIADGTITSFEEVQ